MNVFIDTNLYLDFYRMGQDKLEELNKIFVLHEYGKLKIWLPELIKNEFWRNRSKVVADNIKEIGKDYKPSLPHIFRQHADQNSFLKSVSEANILKNKIFEDIQQQFKNETLPADLVIKKIFESANKIEADEANIEKGKRRYDLGNPPGKNKSYGDAVNWECLLTAIPEGEDIYLITDDSDYKSSFIKDDMNEYLKHEWQAKKKSKPHIYARLSEFIKEHYPQANNLADMEVNLIIKELEESASFASTHRIISKLLKFKNFNKQQIYKLINIYSKNNQVSFIIKDPDVNRLAHILLQEGGKEADPEGIFDSFKAMID